MAGSVGNIFKVLIVVVVCVIIGAFIINILLPNVVRQGVGAVERGITAGTGVEIDLNGDNTSGDVGAQLGADGDAAFDGAGATGFQGFQGQGGAAGGN